MKPHAFLSLLAILLAPICGCETPQPQPPKTDAVAIRRVFAADRAAYDDAFGEREDGRKRSATSRVGEYASALRNISFADVPNEFHYAYMEHIHAWESLQVALQRKPEKNDLSIILGLATAVV